MDHMSSSIASSPSKRDAVNFIATLRDSLFEPGTAPRNVTFRTLFGILVLHLGRVLYQIVVTISGFFPTILVLSHIVGFILERCLEVLEAQDLVARLSKILITFLEVAILGMVCALDEAFTVCYVREAAKCGQNKIAIQISSSWKVSDLFQEVARRMDLRPDSFQLVLVNDKNGNTILNNSSETIEMAGLRLDGKNELLVHPKTEDRSFRFVEYTVSEQPSNAVESRLWDVRDYTNAIGPPAPPPPPLPASTSSAADYNHSSNIFRQEIGYVGLVNQAMTCYLNSLLQALFMTPEFRNALYNWEYDGSQSDESKSIPYQLQKLFLNLQTSNKSAVETTELTRSFGWDFSEAWQQHDIQELCRVMFDALEQKFKNTEQSDLINRLYEGKMIDYVKCLECSTEKFREDTFLDIPLPLRPFGSAVACESVEEALRAFVQPETLEGNNQYFCETCNKKCDAHKGLKFSKFPYLLTLHLKRFDFDYTTLHRIKLNDKVTFPEKLNLNSFIVSSLKSEDIINGSSPPEETAVKCDDSSTTDSGSALDDEGCQGIDSMTGTNPQENHNNEYQEDDEGIDVCQNNENEKNKQNAMESGPYVYELFSIMIHSGGAAGGHYYAYIKDFNDGEWYCFNDQTVTRITYEDIKKTYGGESHRGYYSGVYSSSTNAYMLMYRQIDPGRNSSPMTFDEFPPHMKALHKRLEEQKELESKVRESDLCPCKLRVYCCHPVENVIRESKIYFPSGFNLREAVVLSRMAFNLDKIVPEECCRLVSYNRAKDTIECSFEGKEEEFLSNLVQDYMSDFLLEIKKEGEEFEVYTAGHINTKVYLINIETEEVKGPILVRGNLNETVGEYKETVAKNLKLPVESLHIIVQKYNYEPKLLTCDDSTLRKEDFYGSSKIYIVSFTDEDQINKPEVLAKLQEIIEIFGHVVTINIALPNVDNEILEQLNIPPLEQSQSTPLCPSLNIRQTDELLLTNQSRGGSPYNRDPSPQPLPDPEDECMGPAEPHSDQSASEDSSLTDSERTIVGEAPGDCLAQLSPSNSSVGSDQNASSPENEGNYHDMKTGELYVRRKSKHCLSLIFVKDEMGESWDADEQDSSDILNRGFNCYFKATPYVDNNTNQKMLKVSVDKRMTQRQLKQCLESYVGVSADHFKIYRSDRVNPEDECSRPSESLSTYGDGDELTIKLGRILRKGEYIGNVYLLAIDAAEPFQYFCEWVIANGSSVAKIKKEILDEYKKKHAIEFPYNHFRLRRKNGKNPERPYLDDSTFDDLSNNWEMFLQWLPGNEPVTSPGQMLLFVRQWCPSTLEIKHFQEIVLDTNQVTECRDKISQLSGIPPEYIDIAEAQGSFPCIDVSVLGIHSDLDWKPASELSERCSIKLYGDGQVIFYKDSRERLKLLSSEEKKDILSWDKRGRLVSSSVSSYSPRKERALKIYLDATPPRRREEADVD